MRRGRRLIIAVAAAGALLVLGYVSLGGGRYEGVRSADPCQAREWRDPRGGREIVEQIGLSALDGAACELRVTREALAFALADDEELRAFARREGTAQARIERVLRSGLQRAVGDGLRAGALQPVTALIASQVVDRIPFTALIDAYRSGRLDWLADLVT